MFFTTQQISSCETRVSYVGLLLGRTRSARGPTTNCKTSKACSPVQPRDGGSGALRREDDGLAYMWFLPRMLSRLHSLAVEKKRQLLRYYQRRRGWGNLLCRLHEVFQQMNKFIYSIILELFLRQGAPRAKRKRMAEKKQRKIQLPFLIRLVLYVLIYALLSSRDLYTYFYKLFNLEIWRPTPFSLMIGFYFKVDDGE